MDLNELRQIKGYVNTDISREIQLAKISDTYFRYVLDFLNINRGGGNMMATLTLLDYTEFVGHVYAQLEHTKKYDPFTVAFNHLKPSDYKKLSKTPIEIRDIIRNSLVYPLKKNPDIVVGMLCNNFCKKHNTNAGIIFEDDLWYFCVEKYFEDLMDLFDDLENKMSAQDCSVKL